MTNKIENQSQNQPKDKKTAPVKIIESLINFHASLKVLNSDLEELFEQINSDADRLKKLHIKLKGERVLWPLKDAEEHLPMIIFLAAFGKTQYLEYEDLVVEVNKGQEEVNIDKCSNIKGYISSTQS